jgi:hypothetical protein
MLIKLIVQDLTQHYDIHASAVVGGAVSFVVGMQDRLVGVFWAVVSSLVCFAVIRGVKRLFKIKD